jgi:DNA polymerase I-like protein with 3'-5' exonuclease and polymerase domains
LLSTQQGFAGDLSSVAVVRANLSEHEKRYGAGSDPDFRVMQKLVTECTGQPVRSLVAHEKTAWAPYEHAPTMALLIGADAQKAVVGWGIDSDEAPPAIYSWLDWGNTPVPAIHLPSLLKIGGGGNALHRKLAREIRTVWKRTTAGSLPKPPPTRCHIVESPEDAECALVELRKAEWVAFDLETVGRAFDSCFRVTSVALVAEDSEDAYVWPFSALRDDLCLEPLLGFFREERPWKEGHNGIYDLRCIFAAWGTRVAGYKGDSLLYLKCLDSSLSGKLEVAAACVGYGGHKQEMETARKLGRSVVTRHIAKLKRKDPSVVTDAQKLEAALEGVVEEPIFREAIARAVVAGFPAPVWEYGLVHEDILSAYNAADTMATAKLAKHMRTGLQVSGQAKVWDKLLVDAVPAVLQMELNGFLVDRHAVSVLHETLDAAETLARLTISGHTAGVNLKSNAALAHLLYDTLGLQRIAFTKGGDASVDRKTLAKLLATLPTGDARKDFLEALLDLKKTVKMRDAFLSSFEHVRDDGRVHPSYKLHGTRCLPEGELVLTSRGYIPVEQVRIGDSVISHTGATREVTDAFQVEASPIYKVRLENGLELRSTGNHPFRVGSGWVEARMLTPGDLVTVHSGPEEWRSIQDWYPYEVSSWGRVRNSRTGTVRKQSPKGSWGHLKVCLSRNGAQKRGPDRKDFTVHKLVARAFFGAPPAGHEVRHLSGVAWDNTARNLAYGTPEQNRRDALHHGTMSQRRAGRTKLTQADVDAIRALPRCAQHNSRSEGVPDWVAAKQYGVTRECVRDIRSGKRWPSEAYITGKQTTFFQSPVVAVEMCAPEVTFAMTVAVDASHVTGGIVTHNTGRLSASDPNVQQCPRTTHPLGKLVRDCYVAAPGYVLLQLDFSQVELRVAAAVSHDAVMREAFEQGLDLHMETAKAIAPSVWGIPPEQATKQHRTASKSVVFGSLYGLGVRTLAEDLGLSLAEAEKLQSAIFGRYSDLARWVAKQRQEVKNKHVAHSVWVDGTAFRTRGLVGVTNTNYGLVSRAANGSVNCLDSLTEALTQRGWVAGFDLRHDDILLTKNPTTGALEWQGMTDLKLWPNYEGPVVEFKSRSFHAVTTPDHRWLVNTPQGAAKVVTTQTLQNGSHRIHRTGNYQPVVASTLTPDEAELLGWFLTDGFIRPPKHTGPQKRSAYNGRLYSKPEARAFLCQSLSGNPTKCARIEALLSRLGVLGAMRTSKQGTYATWNVGQALSQKLLEHAPTRVLTMRALVRLDRLALDRLREAMMLGDGTVGKTTNEKQVAKQVFTAGTKEKAEAFQMLCTLTGNAATIVWRDMSMYTPVSPKMKNIPKGKGVWTVTILQRDTAQVVQHQREELHGKFPVWCPMVPNQFFVARRSGTVFITGNTPIQSTSNDLALRALIRLHQWLEAKGNPAAIVAAVHDSVVIEVKREEMRYIAAEAHRIMLEDSPFLGVPLAVDVEWGLAWGSLEKLSL